MDLESTDGKPIQFFDVKNIYFGDSRKDLNLCADKLYTIDAVPVLTGPSAEMILKAGVDKNPSYPDLRMTMSVL